MTDKSSLKQSRKDLTQNPHYRIRMILGGVVLLVIAAIHYFRLGSYLNGDAHLVYYSYASDFLLPFGAYFFLTMNEMQYPVLRNWIVKAWTVFGGVAILEMLQFFSIFLIGDTFDPMDILVYGMGVGLAAFLDVQTLPAQFSDWVIPED